MLWYKKKRPQKLLQSNVDPQDPLPESSWFFRRLVCIGSLIVLFTQRGFELYYNRYNHWTDYLILSILILYTVSPSAEQVVKMIATVSLFGPGKSFAKAVTETTATTITNKEGEQTTTTTTKPAVVKVVEEPQDLDDGELPQELRVKR